MRAGVPARAGLVVAAFLSSTAVARAAGVKLLPLEDPAPQAHGRFGEAMAGLGDIDGDGVGDIAVGAPGKERVVLFSGATRAVIRTLQDPSGLTGNRFGFSVSSAGDVNADGVDDVAVGAPGPPGIIPLPCLDPNDPDCPSPGWGRVLVFSGATGTLLRTIVPSASQFLAFGTALARLGDVNGDGVPDLAVGAPVLSVTFWGEVYAFSGANGAQLWQRKEPPFPNEKQPIPSFGAFLGELGDVDGDGRRDLLVAAPFHDYDPDPSGYNLAGTAHVLSGDDGAVIRTHLDPAPVDGDLFGGTVAGVGDQDGDGKDDYVVAERGASLLHLFSGGGALIRDITGPGNESPDGYFPLAHTDDKDGDGKDDFWVGALKTGSVSLLNAAGSLLAKASDPTPGGGRFGASVAATGDLNGDGRREAAAGEPEQAASGHDGAGRAFVLSLNRTPVADAGPDRVVEGGAGCLAAVVLDGSGSSDPDDDALAYSWSGAFGTATGVMPTVSLPLGTHVVTLSVDDGDGGTDSDTTEVQVVDATAPAITGLEASPPQLWPPNHRWVDVALALSVSDECDPNPACQISSATSSEPANGIGDGNTAAPDIEVTGPLTARLRAERSGGGPGRFYALTVECTDASGNGATATATVTVPHSQH